MRRNARYALLFSIVFLVIPVTLLCQAGRLDAEGTVQQTLSHANGAYTSTDEKALGRLGDASAVALTKIIAGRALEERDVEPLLLIVTLSYSDPRIVEAVSDRQPRTTLMLLRYLDLTTRDPKLRDKIASTQAYVRDQYETSLKQGDNKSQQ